MVDRTAVKGYCGEGSAVRISKIMLHKWEEPCISVGVGSGAVFFSGCPLHCVYCQNREISGGGVGTVYHAKELSKVFLDLQDRGAANINLVTPTHYTDSIIKALDLVKSDLKIPVVWNTSGYEKAETVEMLKGYVDVFLTDFKYASSHIAKKYSAAPDYPKVALAALKKMVDITGESAFDGEKLVGGTIVRHLILPGCYRDSIEVLRLTAEAVGAKRVLLSLMSQYTPEFLAEGYPELNRRITTFEYQKVLSESIRLGFDGYSQDRASATKEYTPEF